PYTTLFRSPLAVIGLILLKTKPLIALTTGVVLAIIFALLFQSEILINLSDSKFTSILRSVFSDTQISTEDEKLTELFAAGGMIGMLLTILLIISAMIFGGIIDVIGALAKITGSLLKLASTVFGLFASTVLSCLGLNLIASDQYLAIVIPGKMFKKAFDDKNLAPENL